VIALSGLGETTRKRSGESGYALIMALFMIVATIITSQVVMRNWVTDGRRIREAEMIWRGNQITRAIRIYYRKTGHYPQTLEDLQKGLPDLHFVRAAAFKDPMNRADGSWRFIYVNAAGQIIGSVRYASLQQMALMDLNGGKIPDSSTAAGGASLPSQSSSSGMSGAGTNQPSGAQAGQSANPSPFGSSGMSGGTSTPGTSPIGGVALTSNANLQAKPTGPVDGPVLGAFLSGVAGGHDYDRPSVKVYKGGKTYQQWEFIWNPLEDQARAIQNGLSPQGRPLGMQGLPIANPNGGGTSAPPANPPTGGQPGQPPQSPPQPPPAPPDQPLVQ
jgi:hypothetical protein